MKLAVAGKGGSGKTTFSGTFARVLARDGHQVLAIDGDSNPNLIMTLGIPQERMRDMPTLPNNLLRRTESGVEMTQTLEEVCAAHSLEGPDGVTLLVMAHPQHAGTGWLCSMHATVRSVIEMASEAAEDVCILDTEASPEHLSRGTAAYADLMLLVVEPYFKSLETGRRMAALGKDLGLERIALIANKVRDDGELDAVKEFAERNGLEIGGVIPFDERMRDAEQAGLSPLDFDPDGPAVQAIRKVARDFVGGASGGNGVPSGGNGVPSSGNGAARS